MMKRITILSDLILLTCIIFHIACKKEYSCENCSSPDKPPIANAGPDQVIKLPNDSALLDGSASRDPDGQIVKWLWMKISGPASNKIDSAAAKTSVKKLSAGSYFFELTVTDNSGLFAKDTVKVQVNPADTINLPPHANAGADTTIFLPTDTANLNGSGSSDPENDIVSYSWVKISGPPSYTIVSGYTPKTQVTNLVQGVYIFELTVTDKGGLSSKDTMQVTVNAAQLSTCNPGTRPLVNTQLIPVTNIPIGSTGDFCSSGDKLFFLAWDSNNNPDDTFPESAHFNIYDVTSQAWSVSSSYLIAQRGQMALVAAGNKVFIAGGYYVDGVGLHYTLPDLNVYDISADTWTTKYLELPRRELSTAVAGNKVFFAGGIYHPAGASLDDASLSSDLVEIYDLSANTWSSTLLSQARSYLSIVTVAGNTYFAGGENYSFLTQGTPFVTLSDKIDIYNDFSGAWSASSLTEPKVGMAGITGGNQIFWAGGHTNSGLTANVEIRDVNTPGISMACLFQPNDLMASIEQNNKFVFFTGDGAIRNKFDIYDTTRNAWSIGVLSQNIDGKIILADNTIYVVGWVDGTSTKQIWKLVL